MVERGLDHISVELSRACDVSAFISVKLNESTIDANLRNRVVASCFAVTLDHYDAVLALLGRAPQIYSSAFALARLVFESYIRGMWFMLCASDEQLEAFSNNSFDLPKNPKLINSVEKAGGFDGKQLSETYTKAWKHLCDYTHTGTLQVQRWNKSDSIEPSYSDEEVIEIIRFTRAYAVLAAVSFAETVVKNKELAEQFLATAKEISAV